jgi:hypothetical protein
VVERVASYVFDMDFSMGRAAIHHGRLSRHRLSICCLLMVVDAALIHLICCLSTRALAKTVTADPRLTIMLRVVEDLGISRLDFKVSIGSLLLLFVVREEVLTLWSLCLQVVNLLLLEVRLHFLSLVRLGYLTEVAELDLEETNVVLALILTQRRSSSKCFLLRGQSGWDTVGDA